MPYSKPKRSGYKTKLQPLVSFIYSHTHDEWLLLFVLINMSSFFIYSEYFYLWKETDFAGMKKRKFKTVLNVCLYGQLCDTLIAEMKYNQATLITEFCFQTLNIKMPRTSYQTILGIALLNNITILNAVLNHWFLS